MILLRLTKRRFEEGTLTMNSAIRWQPFRTGNTLQEQVNRLFESTYGDRSSESAVTTWAPAVDIYETENELVLKADLPAIDEKDLDIRIENNTLTVRGERKFEKQVNEDNYLRVERSYGSFSRSFTLPNTINTEAIRAEYKNGVLTVQMPKRAESKPKQVKVTWKRRTARSKRFTRRGRPLVEPGPFCVSTHAENESIL